jgi:excisionase family DNA binding protein
MNVPDTYLTIDELARELRVSAKTLERMRARGDGPPALKLGRKRLLYSRAAISRWLRSRQERPDPLSG